MVGVTRTSSNHAFPLYPKHVSMRRIELTTSPMRNAMRASTICDTLPPVDSNVSWSTPRRCVSYSPLAYVTMTSIPNSERLCGSTDVICRPLICAATSIPAATSFCTGRNWYAPRMNWGEHCTASERPGHGIPAPQSTVSHVLPSVHHPRVLMRLLFARGSSNDGFSTWFPISRVRVPTGSFARASSIASGARGANGASSLPGPSPTGESNSTRSFIRLGSRAALSAASPSAPTATPSSRPLPRASSRTSSPAPRSSLRRAAGPTLRVSRPNTPTSATGAASGSTGAGFGGKGFLRTITSSLLISKSFSTSDWPWGASTGSRSRSPTAAVRRRSLGCRGPKYALCCIPV
eukprot:Opistho-1_new@34260